MSICCQEGPVSESASATKAHLKPQVSHSTSTEEAPQGTRSHGAKQASCQEQAAPLSSWTSHQLLVHALLTIHAHSGARPAGEERSESIDISAQTFCLEASCQQSLATEVAGLGAVTSSKEVKSLWGSWIHHGVPSTSFVARKKKLKKNKTKPKSVGSELDVVCCRVSNVSHVSGDGHVHITVMAVKHSADFAT